MNEIDSGINHELQPSEPLPEQQAETNQQRMEKRYFKMPEEPDLDRIFPTLRKKEKMVSELMAELAERQQAPSAEPILPKGTTAHSTVEIEGETLHVYEVEPELIAPYFGHAFTSEKLIFVRSDLPPRVKNSLAYHEGFHIVDTQTWGGDAGDEIRAYAYSAPKDIVGFLQTIWLTLTMKDRQELYLKRVGGWFGLK